VTLNRNEFLGLGLGVGDVVTIRDSAAGVGSLMGTISVGKK
jgi:hypothetical protein